MRMHSRTCLVSMPALALCHRSRWYHSGRTVKLELAKAEYGLGHWDRLVVGSKLPNVLIDWTSWMDEAEENEIRNNPYGHDVHHMAGAMGAPSALTVPKPWCHRGRCWPLHVLMCSPSRARGCRRPELGQQHRAHDQGAKAGGSHRHVQPRRPGGRRPRRVGLLDQRLRDGCSARSHAHFALIR